MIELLGLLLATLASIRCSRRRLLFGNLLLRQQIQVALLTASALPPHPGQAFWLVRCLQQNWRRHLLLVRSETVLRWHRQG